MFGRQQASGLFSTVVKVVRSGLRSSVTAYYTHLAITGTKFTTISVASCAVLQAMQYACVFLSQGFYCITPIEWYQDVKHYYLVDFNY